MVKLLFNPKKNSESSSIAPESKSSKKEEINLNPFNNTLECSESKFVPQQFLPCKSLVGLENTHYILKTWYEKCITDNSNKFLLIIGPTGCGKTTLIESFCKEENVLLYSVNNNLGKKDLIKDILNFSDYVTSEGTNFFTKAIKSKKLILIDEYQNSQNDILSLTDINNMLTLRTNYSKLTPSLMKEINSTFNEQTINNIIPPIVIISSDSKGSKLSELKKTSNVYYIGEIGKSIIKSWIKPNCDHLKTSELELLLDKCKSDKRLLLNTLNFLKTHQSQNIDKYINSFYKDIDINHFEFIEKLFDKLEPIDNSEIFKVYETDGYLLSNLVHENYLDYSDSIEQIADAAESISLGETIYSDMFDSTRIFIPEVHCASSLYIPSYYARSEVKNNKCQLRCSVINNRFNIYLNNKKIIDKINKEAILKLNIIDIFQIKKFLTYELIKSKVLTQYQNEYLKSLLECFTKENAVSSLELIYKYFTDFKDTSKEPKTKIFTIKFKEKINKL